MALVQLAVVLKHALVTRHQEEAPLTFVIRHVVERRIVSG
jgi:hypothetical protein